MGISIVSLLPQFAAKPTSSAKADAEGTATGSPDQGFTAILALLAAATATKAAQNQGQKAPATTPAANNAGLELQQVLQALTSGKVDLQAPGLGLSTAQREELLSNLGKLLKDAEHDGEQLLASLLAASQTGVPAAPAQPLDLGKLLGASGEDEASISALASNVQLLVQALQVVSNSDGKLTLLQAVQELAPQGDPFAEQLAKTIQGTGSDTEAPDTGPPEGPGQASGQVSATAGSDGRELTVGTQPASPTDGAAQEASQSQTQPQGDEPDVLALAHMLESLVQVDVAKPAASPVAPSEGTGVAPNPGQPAAQIDLAAEFAQMLNASAASTQTRAPGQPAQAGQPRATLRPLAGGSVVRGATEKAEPLDQKPADPAVKVVVATPDPGTPSQDGGGAGGQAAPQGQAQATPTPTTATQAPADTSSPFAALAAAVNVDSGVRPAEGTQAATAPQRAAAIEQAVVEQIVQHATLSLRNGEQEFRIQLKPEFLGQMEVRVSVSDGTALVRMTAENAGTRQLIDANIGQLRQAFGTDHVRIEHVPTFAGANASWSSLNQGGYQGFWQGQNPYDGSTPMPEAIAFSGEPEPVASASTVASEPLGTRSSDIGPNAIDLQA